MKCACPKCDTTIEIQDQKISASPAAQQCSDCREKYWFRRENFNRRAYRKQGRLYCIDCGEELGNDVLCRHCGRMCPDYCVVQIPRFVSHKQQKGGPAFSLNRKSRPSVRAVPAPKATGRKANITRLTYAVLAGLVLVLVGGLGKLYLDSNTHQAYAKNFVVALYGVKSGTDLSLDLIDSLAGEWQKNLGAGGIAPRASQKDLDKLGKVKQRISQAMTGLEDCPEKFVTARQKLVRLHGIYEQIYALNVSKANSLDELNASEARLKTAFFKAADDLKRVMPEELSTELKSSVARYNNLNFLVKG